MATFHLYSPVHFEKWDWRNSVEKGIGGSETNHVEMAWRLARRGHTVISYAPIPDDCSGEWRGTTWKRIEDADFSDPGIWVLYRCPDIMDKFTLHDPYQQRWLMCQDENYGAAWTPERALKIDRALALCGVHAHALHQRHEFIRNKIWVTSNGVKVDLIREVEKQHTIARNPKKLIYASSPDRGLQALLKIFKRAQEWESDLELHIFYGFDNIDKLIGFNPAMSYTLNFQKLKEDLLASMNHPGIFWRGRISQIELYQEWLSAGIWCYPTQFTETSCITCMEAQSLGAIPITNPLWALQENVMHGIFIEGDPYGDPLTQARYTSELVRLARYPELQDKIRAQMMINARTRFNWERFVDQWESWVSGFPERFHTQFNFQVKHLTQGRSALNVGCDDDPMDFKSLGVVNMDVVEENPVLQRPNKPDIVCDIRNNYAYDAHTHNYRKPEPFATVILGDILEHFKEADAIIALENVRDLWLEENGRVIITCPDDGDRKTIDQHTGSQGDEEYAPGVSCFHTRQITKDDLYRIIDKAGFVPVLYQEIDYTHFMGHGVICVRKDNHATVS